MQIYHLPIEITPKTDTKGEIERLRALLSDPETQIENVVEVRTSHPAIMAVIEALLAEEARVERENELAVKPPEAPEGDPFWDVAGEDATPEPAPASEEPQAEVAATSERACPECKLPFTPERDDQVYCGKKCSKRAYMREYMRKRVSASGSNGDREPETEPTADEPGPASDDAHQVCPWKLPGGQEVNNVQILLAKGKLPIGAKLHHYKRGFFEVAQGKRGLTLKHMVQS